MRRRLEDERPIGLQRQLLHEPHQGCLPLGDFIVGYIFESEIPIVKFFSPRERPSPIWGTMTHNANREFIFHRHLQPHRDVVEDPFASRESPEQTTHDGLCRKEGVRIGNLIKIWTRIMFVEGKQTMQQSRAASPMPQNKQRRFA